ncbi:hypothetical protein [Piscibacillus salipiscarius]|nr:hypothetical protein [Piscibacillus salipiscarius]
MRRLLKLIKKNLFIIVILLQVLFLAVMAGLNYVAQELVMSFI